MSIEDLENDLTANMNELGGLSALSTMGDVVAHLKNTLWPFQANVVAELAQMDEALRTMYEESEDVLQFDTGKELAAAIVGAQTLVAELKLRAAGDAKLLAAIAEWEPRAKSAIETLEEITLPDEPPDEEDDDADDDDDEADNDNAKAEGATQ